MIGVALRECVAELDGLAMAVMEHWELKERDMCALKRKKVNTTFKIFFQNTNQPELKKYFFREGYQHGSSDRPSSAR